MNQKFRLLCAELRLKLLSIDRVVEQIQTDPVALSTAAQTRAEVRIGGIRDHIAARLDEVTAAEGRVRAWVDHGRESAAAQVAAWKAGGNTHDLNGRADDAETYALAVLDLAAAAARECAQAVLEAVLARSDADAACLSPLVSEGAPPS
ncbi:MAG: hypothetical protein ABTQ29_10610 [Siculibacillus sp.]